MTSPLIGRDALERIIRRAAELQAGERDIGEGLRREDLLALGKDVGIPIRYLEQALLEEQTRPGPEDAGLLTRLGGPGVLRTARVVPGDPPGVERRLAERLQEQELLQVKRRFPDRTTWEPRTGAFASLQRAFRGGGNRFALARAAEVAASVTSLETGFCHVQLIADVRTLRRRHLGVALGLLAAGGLVGLALPALGVLAPWPAAPVVAGAVAAFAARHAHLVDCDRIHVSLEQALDQLERGEQPPDRAPIPVGTLGRLADEIRKTFGAAL